MLVQFSATNYRSIKDKVTLSLLASADKEHAGDLITANGKKQLVPVAAIYGANASGKSNMLMALKTMQDMGFRCCTAIATLALALRSWLRYCRAARRGIDRNNQVYNKRTPDVCRPGFLLRCSCYFLYSHSSKPARILMKLFELLRASIKRRLVTKSQK